MSTRLHQMLMKDNLIISNSYHQLTWLNQDILSTTGQNQRTMLTDWNFPFSSAVRQIRANANPGRWPMANKPRQSRNISIFNLQLSILNSSFLHSNSRSLENTFWIYEKLIFSNADLKLSCHCRSKALKSFWSILTCFWFI